MGENTNIVWFRHVAETQRNANFLVDKKTGNVRVEPRNNPFRRIISWIRAKMMRKSEVKHERQAAYDTFLRAIGSHFAYDDKDVSHAAAKMAAALQGNKPLSARKVAQVLDTLNERHAPPEAGTVEHHNWVQASYFSDPGTRTYSQAVRLAIKSRPLLSEKGFQLSPEQNARLSKQIQEAISKPENPEQRVSPDEAARLAKATIADFLDTQLAELEKTMPPREPQTLQTEAHTETQVHAQQQTTASHQTEESLKPPQAKPPQHAPQTTATTIRSQESPNRSAPSANTESASAASSSEPAHIETYQDPAASSVQRQEAAGHTEDLLAAAESAPRTAANRPRVSRIPAKETLQTPAVQGQEAEHHTEAPSIDQSKATQVTQKSQARVAQNRKSQTQEKLLLTLRSLGMPSSIKDAVRQSILDGKLKTNKQLHAEVNRTVVAWAKQSRMDSWYREALKGSKNPDAVRLARRDNLKVPDAFIKQVTDAIGNREQALNYSTVEKVAKLEAKKYMGSTFSRF